MNFILLIFIEIGSVMKIEPNVISNGKIIKQFLLTCQDGTDLNV